MQTRKNLLILFSFLLMGCMAMAQKGDYSIVLSLPSASVAQNDAILLKAHVCNNGVPGSDYVSNSLRVVISMSNGAEITGINTASDSHWKLESMTAGSGNTIRLVNKGGTVSASTCGDILLNVRGNSIDAGSTITSNISFIAAINPLLNNSKGAPNAIQGNLDISNDNSRALLTVTAPTKFAHALTSILSIYPNPATDKVYVTGAVSNSNILLFDVNGKLLQSVRSTGSSVQEISLTGLLKGNYLLRVTGTDATRNFKLMKQ